MRIRFITLSISFVCIASCSSGSSRAYTKETAKSLQNSLTEEKRHYSDLLQQGRITQACMDAIQTQIDLALMSLDLDQQGDITGRDRALRLSEDASVERKELGCL